MNDEKYHQLWHHPDNTRAFGNALLIGSAVAFALVAVILTVAGYLPLGVAFVVAAIVFAWWRVDRTLDP